MVPVAWRRAHDPLLRWVFMGLLSAAPMTPQAAGPPPAIDHWLEALEQPDTDRRWEAIDRLGASGDRGAVAPLIKALRKDFQQRRGFTMSIIPALGQLGDPHAVPILLEALNNREEHWLGREAAARALGKIGSTAAVASLIEAAWQSDTRSAAIGALAEIGDPEAIEVLISTFDPAEEPEVRTMAADGLVGLGTLAVPALIDRLENHHPEYPAEVERVQAAELLGKIGDPRAIAPLKRALKASSGEVRNSAQTALGLLAQPAEPVSVGKQ